MRIYLNLIRCDYSRREVFCYKPKIRMLKINEFYYLVYSFDYPFNQNQRIKSFYHFPQITLQMIFLQKTRSIFEILSVSPCEFLYQTWICLEDFHDKLAVCRVFICEFHPLSTKNKVSEVSYPDFILSQIWIGFYFLCFRTKDIKIDIPTLPSGNFLFMKSEFFFEHEKADKYWMNLLIQSDRKFF